MVGNNIETFATILSFYNSNGNYFFKIGDKTGNISAIIFKQAEKNIDLSKIKKGDQITIFGKISIYKDNLEIIANKIEFII